MVKTAKLGTYLATLRAAKNFSLREVEEVSNKGISNAYLSQLEKGKISKPSPNILHILAEIYSVPYERLMDLAGYITTSRQNIVSDGLGSSDRSRSITGINEDEEKTLLDYLAFYRQKNKSK